MEKMGRAFEVINAMVEAGNIRRYAVTGAVAALNYLEPTLTDDLDILISVEDLENQGSGIATLGRLFSYLSSLGYNEFRNEGVVIDGWPVQFLPVANPLDAEALANAIEVEVRSESSP